MASEYSFNISDSIKDVETSFHKMFKEQYESKRYKPQEGGNAIRILPPSKFVATTFNNFGIPVYRHFIKGSANDGAYVCPAKNPKLKDHVEGIGEVCPLCLRNDELTRHYGFKKVPQELNCYASLTILVWVVDRMSTSSEPKLWTMPVKQMARALSFVSLDEDTGEILPICDPNEGYDVRFQLTQKGGQASFVGYDGVKLSKSPSPICTDKVKIKKYLEFIETHSLEKTLLVESSKDLQVVFPSGEEAGALTGIGAVDVDEDVPNTFGTSEADIPEEEITEEIADPQEVAEIKEVKVQQVVKAAKASTPVKVSAHAKATKELSEWD